MKDFKECVPGEARAYYIELFKERTKAERNKYNAKILAIRNQTAAQAARGSGHADKASWDAKAEQLDSLAIGLVEDVLDVYKERELALTPAICSSLTETAREYLDTAYRNQLKLYADGMLGFRLLNSCIKEIPTRKFAAMPKINILIEQARLASVKKKSEVPSSTSVYNLTQHNYGSHNVTMTGDITAQQQYNFNQLAVELESLRKALKSQPTPIDAGDLKLLEDAENAAKEQNSTKLQRCLGKVSEGTREVAKSVGMEIAKHAVLELIKNVHHLIK